MLDGMLAKEHASTGRGFPGSRTPCPVGIRVYVDTLKLLAWVVVDQARFGAFQFDIIGFDIDLQISLLANCASTLSGPR